MPQMNMFLGWVLDQPMHFFTVVLTNPKVHFTQRVEDFQIEANSHKILTHAKKGESRAQSQGSKLGFRFGPIQFSTLMPCQIMFLVH